MPIRAAVHLAPLPRVSHLSPVVTLMSSIDVLLQEDRKFPPPDGFRKAALIADAGPYERATADFEAYWEEQARALTWRQEWRQVLEWNPPRAKWFLGGKLNVCENCIDRHIDTPRRNKAALIWEGE